MKTKLSDFNFDSVAAAAKIKEGPLDIITIGFVAKFYPIVICVTFLQFQN